MSNTWEQMWGAKTIDLRSSKLKVDATPADESLEFSFMPEMNEISG